MKEAAPKAEFFAPKEPEDPWIGKTLTFETTDLDGNTVRSEELFAKHDITMLNFWATWCEPCKGELRELGAINRRMQAENCAIVGILNDEDSEETIELGKALLEENGVDYLNLKMPAVLGEAEIAVSLPTSVFVDSNGVIIAPLVKRAFVNLYETKFHELLDGTQPAAADAVVENNNGAYRVIVSDQDGNAVKGVTVQFCSDVTCTLAKTDADGLASFDADEGQVYTIHILKIPEGFEKNNEEFRTLETYCDTKIVIQKTA
jgi:thiol-disulfide isomerase/thioredoxin